MNQEVNPIADAQLRRVRQVLMVAAQERRHLLGSPNLRRLELGVQINDDGKPTKTVWEKVVVLGEPAPTPHDKSLCDQHLKGLAAEWENKWDTHLARWNAVPSGVSMVVERIDADEAGAKSVPYYSIRMSTPHKRRKVTSTM